jgi:hypothetical protein
MVIYVRGFLNYCRSPRGRLVVNVVSGLIAVTVAVLAARHFAETGWPLAHADLRLLFAASGFFLLAYLFKALGWHRLFAGADRPSSMALAAAGGAATVGGAALPGRFDDVVRVAVVRRYSGVQCVPTVCFSLFMLGLIGRRNVRQLCRRASGHGCSRGRGGWGRDPRRSAPAAHRECVVDPLPRRALGKRPRDLSA